MSISFALFDGDTVLWRGDVLVTSAPGISVFGEHVHVGVTPRGGQASLLRGAIVEHKLEGAHGVIEIRFHDVVLGSGPESEPASVLRMKGVLRVPLHTSDDWESIELVRYDRTPPPYVLAFRCDLPV